MKQDYAKTPGKKKKQKPNKSYFVTSWFTGSILWFFSIGITIILILVFIYMKDHGLYPSKKTTNTAPIIHRDIQVKPIKPHFEFYTALPKDDSNTNTTFSGPVMSINNQAIAQSTTAPATKNVIRLPIGIAPTYLHVGSFSQRIAATQLKDKLTLQAFNTIVRQSQVNNHIFYRVYVGPYTDPNAIAAAEEVLSKMHISSVEVLNVPQAKFRDK